MLIMISDSKEPSKEPPYIGKRTVFNSGNSKGVTIPIVYFNNFDKKNDGDVIAFDFYLGDDFSLILKPVIENAEKVEQP